MKSFTHHRKGALLAVLAMFVLLTSMALPSAAQSSGGRVIAPKPVRIDREQAADIAARSVRMPDGRIQVVVNLSSEPAVRQYVALGGRAAGESALRGSDLQRAAVRAEQAAFENAVRGLAEVVNSTSFLTNTVTVAVDVASVPALALAPGVRGVYPNIPLYREDTVSVPHIGAPDVWDTTPSVAGGEYTGDGMVISIIDSGVDYTHVMFGGDGTYNTDNTVVGGADDGFGTSPVNVAAGAQKVVGGWDFVGDAFDGDDNVVIDADPDPIDCTINAGGGHGTHVAGTAGGYGVTATGATFVGPYDSTIFASYPGASNALLRIGPGVAPQATLLAMKVFGCDGSTDSAIMAAAIEASVSGQVVDTTDFDGDNDTTEIVATFPPANVINMSIGATFGTADPDFIYNAAVREASQAGVAVTISAGNTGDVFFVTGSPSQTNEAISTSSMRDPSLPSNTVRLDTTMALYNATYGAGSPFPHTDLTAVVIRSDPLNGCTPFTNAAAVAGKIVLIDRGVCNFSVKQDQAFAAGAAGVIVANVASSAPGPVYMAAASASGYNLPTIHIEFAAGEAIRAAVDGTNTVTMSAFNFNFDAEVAAGTNSSFTSRGPSRDAQGNFKPDIAAPGDTILSAGSGSGSFPYVLSGTSMAAPHMAGVMALLMQRYPTWTVDELKALAMNTATNDVMNASPSLPHSPQRVGAGRVDVPNAFNNEVIAYNADNPFGVSVSFGFPEVVAGNTVNLEKTITVENKSATAAEYDVSYVARTDMQGIAIAPLDTTVSVPAGGTATITVTLSGNPNIAGVHTNSDPTLATANRVYLTEEAGYIVLNATSGASEDLRVPVYAAPSLNSNMSANDVVLDSATGDSFDIALTGGGFSTGTGATNITSFVTPFELLATDGNEAGVDDSMDIRYIGITDDFATAPEADAVEWGGIVYVAIVTHGEWNTLNQGLITLLIDFDDDDIADIALANGSGSAGRDSQQVVIYDLTEEDPAPVAFGMPLNYFSFATHTGLLNNNVVVFPLPLEDFFGYADGNTFEFWVESSEGFDATFDTVGSPTERLSYTIGAKTYDFHLTGTNDAFYEMPTYIDEDGGFIPVIATGTGVNDTPDILLLHHHNTGVSTAELVSVDIDPAVTFDLLTPANGAALTTKTAVSSVTSITWEESAGAETYNFVLTRPNPLTPVSLNGLTPAADTDGLTCGAGVCTLTPVDLLALAPDNGSYSWTVTAFSPNGSTANNQSFTFTVDVPAPTAFSLIGPASGGLVTNPAVQLTSITWAESDASVNTYTFTLLKLSNNVRIGEVLELTLTPAADSDALTCATGTCTLAIAPATLGTLTTGQYAWTVVADNGYGTTEASNGAFLFSINLGDIELLRNGGFEEPYPSNPAKPAGWTRTGSTGDRVRCRADRAFVGTCYYEYLPNPGELSFLTQTVTGDKLTGLDNGSVLSFSARVSTGAPAPRIRVRIIVTYASLPTQTVAFTVPAGTGYQEITNTVTLQGVPTSVRVEFRNRTTTNVVRLDEISLKTDGLAPRSTGTDGALPLPLPDANQ